MSFSLAHFKGTIAVSGLKTGDNPQPGVPVIRSIRNAGFEGKIIGLIYDSLESGIYVRLFMKLFIIFNKLESSKLKKVVETVII